MEVYAPVLFVHVVDEFSVIPMEYFKRSSLNNTIYSDYKKETEQYIEYNKYSGNISIGLPPDPLIVKVVVSKNLYFLFVQVIRYCSVPDVSINK